MTRTKDNASILQNCRADCRKEMINIDPNTIPHSSPDNGVILIKRYIQSICGLLLERTYMKYIKIGRNYNSH